MSGQMSRCIQSNDLQISNLGSAGNYETMYKNIIIIIIIVVMSSAEVRGARWRSWLRHCATSRKVAGSIPDGVTGMFQ
jgi:hypothetical protein